MKTQTFRSALYQHDLVDIILVMESAQRRAYEHENFKPKAMGQRSASIILKGAFDRVADTLLMRAYERQQIREEFQGQIEVMGGRRSDDRNELIISAPLVLKSEKDISLHQSYLTFAAQQNEFMSFGCSTVTFEQLKQQFDATTQALNDQLTASKPPAMKRQESLQLNKKEEPVLHRFIDIVPDAKPELTQSGK